MVESSSHKIKTILIVSLLAVVIFITAASFFININYSSNIKPENGTKASYIKILFAGDIMFDRGIRYYTQKSGSNDFAFQKIYDTLKNYDLVVANLEGPITNNKSVSSGTVPGSANNFYFTFDPSFANVLYNENIKLVNLGNNHITNFGQAGVISTQNYLAKAEVSYFGAPGYAKSILKEIDGIKITFVNYNQFSGQGLNAEQAATLQAIKKAKLNSDFVVIFCHWGVEYAQHQTIGQILLAHQFIDNGADLVIGTHPHVIEPMETYKGKRIYYSLGNFIFDQYFEGDVRNELGVVLEINQSTKQVSFSEEHFYLNKNGQTILK